ncbi:TPA: Hok/Gef family protein [Escherichia coli]|nr:Hok/Gef family protein [Escherichia coli]HAW2731907.1 Hok/Gef family protein [Escherichia coli]
MTVQVARKDLCEVRIRTD